MATMTPHAAAGAAGWREAPMFQGRANIIATTVVGALLAYLTWRLASWSVIDAIWTVPEGAGSSVCRAARSEGACWAVIGERFRFILFGAYPFDEQWRPAVACLLFLSLYLASARRAWWTMWLLGLWAAIPGGAVMLLRGGALGLAPVPSEFWGGLPMTLVLSTVGFSAAFPLAVVLAFGRRSQLPAIRALSVGYIELVRGVPIITFLFMAAVMFPLFVPRAFTVDKLLRAQLAFVLVMAGYLAEAIRGGLQAIPRGQYEAAASMGLPFWPAMILVVLPQALRLSIPSIVNTFIAFFKDTSLVAVIGLFDLLGAAKTVIVDPRWIGFGLEVYLFVAALYFVFCYAVSRYSRQFEKRLAAQTHH
jgi:general L-amino acid transport system permease protein